MRAHTASSEPLNSFADDSMLGMLRHDHRYRSARWFQRAQEHGVPSALSRVTARAPLAEIIGENFRSTCIQRL